jgi:hypothetical protein
MAKRWERRKEARATHSGDPSQSLQTLTLHDLQQYTQEKAYSVTASKDFYLFFAARDDVHAVL